MVAPLVIPQPEGRCRNAETHGEQSYAGALSRHARARSALGVAVEVERSAFREFLRQVALTGPIHPAADEAHRLWREAQNAKRQAAAEVSRADDALEGAYRNWCLEAAQVLANREARGG